MIIYSWTAVFSIGVQDFLNCDSFYICMFIVYMLTLCTPSMRCDQIYISQFNYMGHLMHFVLCFIKQCFMHCVTLWVGKSSQNKHIPVLQLKTKKQMEKQQYRWLWLRLCLIVNGIKWQILGKSSLGFFSMKILLTSF